MIRREFALWLCIQWNRGDFARFEHGLPPGHCTHYKKSGKTTKVDITEHLDYEMAKNAKDLQKYKNKHGYIKSVVYFVDNVKTGGAWDFKIKKYGDSQQILYIIGMETK